MFFISPSRPRIQWPKGKQKVTPSYLDQDFSLILANHLKGPTSQQIRSFYSVVNMTWGVATRKGDKVGKFPNRCQLQKGKIRAEQRGLKGRLKEAPYHERVGLFQTWLIISILISWRSPKLRTRENGKREGENLRNCFTIIHSLLQHLGDLQSWEPEKTMKMKISEIILQQSIHFQTSHR